MLSAACDPPGYPPNGLAEAVGDTENGAVCPPIGGVPSGIGLNGTGGPASGDAGPPPIWEARPWAVARCARAASSSRVGSDGGAGATGRTRRIGRLRFKR
jgi:hypothetical protein